MTTRGRSAPPKRISWGRTARFVLHHIVSIFVAAIFVLPLVFVVSASLRRPGLPPPRGIEWVPTVFAWSNYGRIFELAPLGRYLLNSALVVGLAVPLTLVTASWPAMRWLSYWTGRGAD
ncbi:MAG: hypothetical protein WKH64_15520 [Chloroflexia bacterium]